MIARVLHDLADDMSGALGDAGTVTLSVPATLADLPAVTLAATNLTESLVGIGRLPRGSRTGALELTATVDLADPVLDLGPGESLTLLDPERHVLTLPHGPIVRADGTSDPPFSGADIAADDGAPFEVRDTDDPTGREFVCDPVLGTLRFGSPLPPAGHITVTYHVGQWDVTVNRYQGLLEAQLTAPDEEGLALLTDRVGAVLAGSGRTPGRAGPRLTARDYLAAEALVLQGSEVRNRLLRYRLDAELEEPLLTSGGGVISRVAVRARLIETEETFTVEREGNPA